MIIVPISGKAQHGKDTFANALYEELTTLGKRVHIVHYGDYVKYIAKTHFKWDGNKDEVGRSLIQHVGTEVARKYDPNFWVFTLMDEVEVFLKDSYDFILIPDARFPNEIEIPATSYHFKVKSIRITRKDFESTLTEEQKNHPSETALDNYKFDWSILNGDLNDLKINARLVAESLILDNII